MKLTISTEFGLYHDKDKSYCDSLQIAETFGKRHDNVLADIRGLDCSDGFRLLNFQESYYKNDQNKRQPKYLITKDGFSFLVMGYRGKKAARFKEAYIQRFNKMEDFIEHLQLAHMDFPALTDAIMDAHDTPLPFHYSNEIDMIYRLAIGFSARQYRANNGLQKHEGIRPHLSTEQIHAVENLQRIDVGLLAAGLSYEQRKEILSSKCQRMLSIAS